ncbi:PulJ/GspJ family protein [Thermocoleostomius sinensis]|uniref:Prepilin-type N-terminal cleavage/methylation domain-containing protein n=1 Tax=Thermocoleostomius sinensis A174 TaxID=2016057 RepID=A0A9E8ZB52_9CYAN|nr:prepilin-type N-terminal cleavage/methylation domain-containing protein [Thermocoleostomius sinensis]WAL58163.1 prepilin-type N-terminal cleavage/methylation domain-containing protein [Thermocoleostomius sinensis A174]
MKNTYLSKLEQSGNWLSRISGSFTFRVLFQFFRKPRRQSTQGFTLLEVLVVTAIGGSIIAGLMFIVVQLMDTDQRESSRSETQREMQMALDYISSELREAVYVYTGEQLRTLTNGGHLPASLTTNSVPVIAFWKHQPFPEIVRRYCQANMNATGTSTAITGINCETASSYALVVYSLSIANDNNIWSGEARIVRYALTEFKSSSGNSTPEVSKGYVNPAAFSNFNVWPFDKDITDATRRNLQDDTLATTYRYRNGRETGRPDARGATAPLVDFVGHQSTSQTASCPDNFVLSPSNTAIEAAPRTLKNARTFYACVRPRVTEAGIPGLSLGDNQEVILFLQGSVSGRPGYDRTIGARSADKLPALETRILTRGILNRSL